VPLVKSVVGRGLAHEFPGTRRLFTGLDIELRPAEVTAVVGPSGSGKSTLLSILAGWVTPTEGTVERTGIAHVGWVFQNPHGVARRTALDHVVLPLLARGQHRSDAQRQARHILDRFGLGKVTERPYQTLSGGEAQRLMLARAIATGDDLLLVDEPTAQLDLATAGTVTAVLAQIGREDAIVVVATHDAHARDQCDRVIDLSEYQSGTGSAEIMTTSANQKAVGRIHRARKRIPTTLEPNAWTGSASELAMGPIRGDHG